MPTSNRMNTPINVSDQPETIDVSTPQKTAFFNDLKQAQEARRPLFIGCSGGAGHNQSIEAIRLYLTSKNYYTKKQLTAYKPNLEGINDFLSSIIKVGAFCINNIPGIPSILDVVSQPNIPSLQELTQEVANLKKAEENKKERYYIDMLLDIPPAGYWMAAIWNVLQRKDKIHELNKLIDCQGSINKYYYSLIKQYFLETLKSAKTAGNPYTEIISTQPMALAALCDAVKEYNDEFKAQITIHQYVSDLPTAGAKHFFREISQLNDSQCGLMYLYSTGLDKTMAAVDARFSSISKKPFRKLCSIDSQDNPMVRPGFKREALRSISSAKILDLVVQTKLGDIQYTIKEKEKIASIMLGSQASVDTIEYVTALAKKHLYSRIFVFGGAAQHIKEPLEEKIREINALPQHSGKSPCEIVYLAAQDDEHIAPIMTRSDLVITRGGCCSVMEQMAMPHLNPEQIILFHNKRNEQSRLTTGISWEDGNINHLMAEESFKNIKVARTSVNEVLDELLLRNRKATTVKQLEDITRAVDDEYYKNTDILTLAAEINKLRSNPEAASFVHILDSLFANIHLTYNTVELREKALSMSKETTAMLSSLRTIVDDPSLDKAAKTQQALQVIHDFEKRCVNASLALTFGKMLTGVVAAAIGFVLGVGLAFGACYLLGSCAAVGCIVPTLQAVCQGTLTAVGLTMAVSGVSTALALTMASNTLFFKKPEALYQMKIDASYTAKDAQEMIIRSTREV